MTFFHFDIGSRARHIGRFIGHVRGELLRALDEHEGDDRRRQSLAERLGIARSLLDGQLSGRKSLTLRDLADLAHALDREIVFELRRPTRETGQNIAAETSTVAQRPIVEVGANAGPHATLATASSGATFRQCSMWGARLD